MDELIFPIKRYQPQGSAPVRLDVEAMNILGDIQRKTGWSLTLIASTMIRFANEHVKFKEE